jgi:ATPase family AAA domain-containing protein 2
LQPKLFPMSSRTKRRLEDFDPNASDPEDLDYGADSPPPQKRRSRPSKSTPKRPSKRQRRGYGDSDDDIVDDDDDDVSEDTFASASEEDDEDDEDVPINPRTGRRVRNAASKEIKYEEPESDIEESIEDTENEESEIHRSNKSRQKLVVKLRIPNLKHAMGRNTRSTRAGSRARASQTPKPPSSSHGVRRSSRISHDDQEPIIALTNSGKHAEIIRAGTRSPEPEIARQIKGGKGLKKPPSAIMEASQETSFPSAHAAPAEDDGLVDKTQQADMTQVASSDVESNHGSDTQPDVPDEEDKLHMSGIIQESVHDEEHEDEDDDDEGPVIRGGRPLRVSLWMAVLLSMTNILSCSRETSLPLAQNDPQLGDLKEGNVLAMKEVATLNLHQKMALAMMIPTRTRLLGSPRTVKQAIVPVFADQDAQLGGLSEVDMTQTMEAASWIMTNSLKKQRNFAN